MSSMVWGKCLWAPEHPGWVVFSFTLHKSLLWLWRKLRHQKLRCSSALNVHWKHLHTKLHSCYTWTHVFGHVSSIWKPGGLKMFLGLWRREGERRDGARSFSSIRILEPVLQWGQVSLSFSSAHFYAVWHLPRHLPAHREQLRPGSSHI